MNTLCNLFKEICSDRFEFLIKKYGFKIGRLESRSYVCYLNYINKTTAVRLSFEPKDGGVFVLLYRLIDGKIPPYEIFIKPDTIINSFYLDDILTLRSPTTKIESKYIDIGRPTREELEKELGAYADALANHAQDILQGDFSIFPELEKIVKRRAAEMT
jgi:hypothetical protein